MLLAWGGWKNWLSLPDSGIYRSKVLTVTPGGSAALWKAQACLFLFLFRLSWRHQIFWTSPNTTWGHGQAGPGVRASLEGLTILHPSPFGTLSGIDLGMKQAASTDGLRLSSGLVWPLLFCPSSSVLLCP